jgi:hypothetical protein
MPKKKGIFATAAETVGIEADGGGSSDSGSRFGISNARWGDVQAWTDTLPWTVNWGNLTTEDVNNAQGDGAALTQLLEHWKQYVVTQTKNLETWEEVQRQRYELARNVMRSRSNVAATEVKLNQETYGHNTRMGVLNHRDANALALERLRLELGIDLENTKHQNATGYETALFGEKTALENTKAGVAKRSLVERYRAARGQVRSPEAKEPTYTPSSGRVLKFERRAG